MVHPSKLTPTGRKLIGLLRQAVADDNGEGLPAISYHLPIRTPGCEVPTTYTVFLSPDDQGTFLVTCRQLPGVTTFGQDEEEALDMAKDAILEALNAHRSSPDFPY